jgi:SAM-dependent methyltransferase
LRGTCIAIATGVTFKVPVLFLALLLLTGFAMVRDRMFLPALHAPAEPATTDRPAHIHQDETIGAEWIRRLERPSRIPGLRIDDVIAALQLKPGDVVADIGAGTGAFTIAFAKAVAPSGIAYAVDIWPELLDHVRAKAQRESVSNLRTILAARDDPTLPTNQVDVVFFHDVFHNVNDRPRYLMRLASYLKPGSRIAIVEQEFDDPIAKQWDRPEDRITNELLQVWMTNVGFHQVAAFDMFQGASNPKGAGMPERWFVVYARKGG